MRSQVVTVGPIAGASAAFYVASVTPAGGAALTLAATVTPDLPRRLSVAYGNEASSRTLTVIGQMFLNGPLVTEVISIPSGGAGSPVQSNLDYYALLSITPSAGTWSAAITVGTNGAASSPWIRLDTYGFPQTALQVDVSGTVNYTVEQTLEDPNDPVFGLTAAQLTWLAHSTLVSKSASAQDNYAYAPVFTRCTLNSGSGSCRFTVIQATTPLRL